MYEKGGNVYVEETVSDQLRGGSDTISSGGQKRRLGYRGLIGRRSITYASGHSLNSMAKSTVAHGAM